MRINDINQKLTHSLQALATGTQPGFQKGIQAGIQGCLYCGLAIQTSNKSKHSHLICHTCYCDLEHIDNPIQQHQIRSPSFDQAFYPLDYGDMSKRLIHQLKLGEFTWSQLASQILAHHLQQELMAKLENPSDIYITNIPMSRCKYLERDTNHAEILASLVAKKLACKHLPQALLLKKDYPSQKTLDANARKKNVEQVFSSMKKLNHPYWLIIDDVLTTGHTLNEAAATLKQAGAEIVYVASLARTPLSLSQH